MEKKQSYVEKRLEHMFEEPGSEYVIVCKEKHSTRYHKASSKETFIASCLRILKERVEEPRWWYGETQTLSEFYDYMKKCDLVPSLTEEQTLALPEGKAKKAAQDEWKYYNKCLRKHNEHNEFILNAQEAVANGDGLWAYQLLEDRAVHEYEDFSIEEVETG